MLKIVKLNLIKTIKLQVHEAEMNPKTTLLQSNNIKKKKPPNFNIIKNITKKYNQELTFINRIVIEFFFY